MHLLWWPNGETRQNNIYAIYITPDKIFNASLYTLKTILTVFVKKILLSEGHTVMSLLAAPSLIEAPPKVSANCYKIVAPHKNRSTPVRVSAPGASNTKFVESYTNISFKHEMCCSRSQWQSRQHGSLVIALGWDCLVGLAGHRQCFKTCDTLQWRYNGHVSVSNHQPDDCLLNRLFRRRSKKTSKLRVTGLCVGG